jgi:hypothetical protein
MLQALPNVKDALLIKSNALPNNASTTVNGTALDPGNALTGRGAYLAQCELLLSAPALNTTMLPDTRTMTYSIEGSVDSAFTSPIALASGCIVQTGAGSAGAAAATFRMKIPSNAPRYIRAKAVSGASTTDASSLSMTLALLF